MRRNPGRSAGIPAHVGLGRCSAICTRLSCLSYLGPEQTIPSITQQVWAGAEPRLRAVMEDLQQRANEGQTLPQSMGVSASRKAARAGARRLESPAYPHQEPWFPMGNKETLGEQQEPPRIYGWEVSELDRLPVLTSPGRTCAREITTATRPLTVNSAPSGLASPATFRSGRTVTQIESAARPESSHAASHP